MREVGLSRTSHYLTRMEARLQSLATDAARRRFLSGEIVKWEERYARFIATEGESHRRGDAADQPSAFDFVETLLALGAVQVRLARDKTL